MALTRDILELRRRQHGHQQEAWPTPTASPSSRRAAADHEPAIEGFVGEGMVDIDVVGDIFAAPGAAGRVSTPSNWPTRATACCYIVLNHAGDMLTGNMTMKQCKKQGLNVVKVVTQEDVSNAPARERRRPPRPGGLHPHVQDRRRRCRRGHESSKRWPPSRSASPTTWRRWPWPCAARPIRRTGTASGRSGRTTRWKSAWASTARRAAAASP